MHLRPAHALVLALAVGCGSTDGPGARAPNAPSAQGAAFDPARPSPPPAFPARWGHAPGEGASTGARGMVSTDAALASKVGRDVLEAGGNAVDAAVATAFALAVVYPAAGNVGGGGFMVARIAGKNHALDFRETAPAKATADMYIDPTGKPSQDSQTGYKASGVPGSVAGLFEAHKKLGSGKKTWADLVAPSIKLAEEGFVVDAAFSKVIGDLSGRLKKHPASAALFLPNGAPPPAGSTWKNPELGAVLRRIAEKGPPGFYTGPTADLLAADMQAHGGLITKDDLAGYEAKWRAPVELTYRGLKISSMPPPSSGGVTLGMICNILQGYDLRAVPWHSAKHIHLEVEAMRRAFAARNARLGDPDFVKNPEPELLSEAWAKAQRETIKENKATPSSELMPRGPSSGDGPHTTHFSVVDAEGNAVGLTTTINWWFGSGVTIQGAGFLMNNEMDDFAAKPGTENGYGLVQGEPNAIAPKKRMLSSMAPTIVTDDAGKVVLVLGAAGGPTIISAVYGILSNVVDYGMDVSAAANAPRFHHQHMPDVITYEKEGLPDWTRIELLQMGYAFKERDHIADAPSIGRGPGPAGVGLQWIGAAEVRRGGAHAAGW